MSEYLNLRAYGQETGKWHGARGLLAGENVRGWYWPRYLSASQLPLVAELLESAKGTRLWAVSQAGYIVGFFVVTDLPTYLHGPALVAGRLKQEPGRSRHDGLTVWRAPGFWCFLCTSPVQQEDWK